jgi:secondary thiamine-phosphate synthase enzyme
MATTRRTISFKTKGNAHIMDITSRVQKQVSSQPIEEGVATVFVPGATGAVTTVEFEPDLMKDMEQFFEELVPEDRSYNHDSGSPTGNAHSHLRASLIGPSVSIPFEKKQLTLGTWQQIIFMDFDNRPRSRELIVQVTG